MLKFYVCCLLAASLQPFSSSDLYPPTIRHLSVLPSEVSDNKYIVEPNSSVNVICFWENGNPPVAARLLDREGKELDSISSRGLIRYSYGSVGCQDAGLIRCQAPGASHNESAPLIVRCPPILNLTRVPGMLLGDGAEVTVDVQSHTTDFMKCSIFKTSSAGGTKCSITSVVGTPPDLKVTVRLDKRQEKEGQWRLELTNDAGTGHVDLMFQANEFDVSRLMDTGITTVGITVTEMAKYASSTTATTEGVTEETSSENSTFLDAAKPDISSSYTVAVVSVLIMTIVAVATSIILFKCTNLCARVRLAFFARVRLQYMTRVQLHRMEKDPDSSSRLSEHLYTEAIDE